VSVREQDIVFEDGDYWVCRQKNAYTVFKCGITHSVSVQSFRLDADGLSLAIAYAKHKAKYSLL
jgi:hypothetical protein